MKQRIENMDIENKRVLVRVDYNVPVKGELVFDDTKIISSLETIRYLIKNNCKIVLLSHLGKIKSEEDKLLNTLEPVAKHLKSLLGSEVYFCNEVMSKNVLDKVNVLKSGEVLLLENTRFLDYPEKLESSCNMKVAEFFASLGDVFVMDAFASCHRAHASTVGITKFIPSCIGFAVEREIAALDRFLKTPEHPFTLIMGGAKVEDKLSLIEVLLPMCDHLLLAGGLANSFLKALNFNIGGSLATNNSEIIEKLKQIMLNNREKLMLPLDAVVGSTYNLESATYRKINEIEDDDVILDIGIHTLNKYRLAINESKTIFLNGTMGLYEDNRFSNGTKEMLNILKNSNANVVVGGGDAISSVSHFGFKDDLTYLSCGGGATLEYLINGSLVGIEAIMEEKEIEVLDV